MGWKTVGGREGGREREREREGEREGERGGRESTLCVCFKRVQTYSEVQLNTIFYKGVLCLCWINLMKKPNNIMM